MHSTLAPRHSGRARRSVEDSIRSPEPPPAQGTKLKGDNDLHTQDPLNPYDPPLVTYHLHTSSIQSRGARGESDDSAWSLPSDVPIFPHICEKTTNDREFIAGRLSFLRAAVVYEKDDTKLDIPLPFEYKLIADTAKLKSRYVISTVSQVHNHEVPSLVRIPPSRAPILELVSSASGNPYSKGDMAPGYRNRDRQRNRTGYVDHDVFEGLPVRHWRRDDVTVAPPPTQENTTSQNDIWAVELPHGMPKDSHLLPQHSQDLLRAARSGRIYKRPAPAEEEEADVEAVLGEKPEKKDDDTKDRGFTAKAWKQIPRHMEGPDVEYLAKRRKGLITITAKAAAPAATLTKTTVKRIDAAGNEYVQDVVVPHGQKVEGEVISQTVIPDPSAAPVDPFAVQQPTPNRKKTSSKKKSKAAAGRGRKKKAAAPTSAPTSVPIDGSATVAEGVDGTVGADGVKIENGAGATPANNEDTEMGDGSMVATDDDDDGDDGDDGEDEEGSVDNQGSPSKPPRPISPVALAATGIKTVPGFGDTPTTGLEFARPHPLIQTERVKSEGQSGSPLRNVAMATSALTSPLESPTVVTPFSDTLAAPQQDPVPAAVDKEILDEQMLLETAESAPTELPQPPPEPTPTEVAASAEVLREEEEEEEMLLDIVENASNAQIGGSEVSIAAPEIYTEQVPIPPTEAPGEPIASEIVDPPKETEPEDQTSLENAKPEPEPKPVPEVQNTDEDDDDFPDLLGGLEKSLEKPEQPPSAPKPTEVEEKLEPAESVNTEVAEGEAVAEVEKKEEA